MNRAPPTSPRLRRTPRWRRPEFNPVKNGGLAVQRRDLSFINYLRVNYRFATVLLLSVGCAFSQRVLDNFSHSSSDSTAISPVVAVFVVALAGSFSKLFNRPAHSSGAINSLIGADVVAEFLNVLNCVRFSTFVLIGTDLRFFLVVLAPAGVGPWAC